MPYITIIASFKAQIPVSTASFANLAEGEVMIKIVSLEKTYQYRSGDNMLMGKGQGGFLCSRL